MGGAVAPERLAGSSWAPIKASRRRALLALSEAKKASPLEAGRLPRLRDLDRSTAKAGAKGQRPHPPLKGYIVFIDDVPENR